MTSIQQQIAMRLAWNKRRLRGPATVGELLKGLDFIEAAQGLHGCNPLTAGKYVKILALGWCYGMERVSDISRLLKNDIVRGDADIEAVPSKHSFSMLKLKAGASWDNCLNNARARLEGLADLPNIPEWFKEEFAKGFRDRASNEGEEEYGFDVLMRYLRRNETIDDLLECMDEKKGNGKAMEFTLQMILSVYLLHHKRFHGMRASDNDECLDGIRAQYGDVSIKTLYADKNRFDPDLLERLYHGKVREIYFAEKSSNPLWIAIDSTQLPVYGTKYTDENGEGPRLDKMHSAGTIREYCHTFNLYVAFDMVRKIPICFHLTGQNLGDPIMMMQLVGKIRNLTGREIRFMCVDRGFQNYEYFDRLDRSGVSFITLADRNAEGRLIRREASEAWRLQNGEMREMDSFYLPGKTCKVRRVILRKDIERKGETREAYILYLTNNHEETPERIIRRYRKRVNIENFFDELKNHGWNIGSFPGWKWDRVLNHVLMIMILYLEVSKFKSMLPDAVLRKAELRTLCDSFLKQKVGEEFYGKHRERVIGELGEGDFALFMERLVGESGI
jgi:hypothetical protein